MDTTGDVTRLLDDLNAGVNGAADRLWPVVYGALRDLADQYLGHEHVGHTLQPTALVHEAFLRLVGNGNLGAGSRGHFFAVAAQAMRRILADHARRRGAVKRGGDLQRVPLAVAAHADVATDEYLLKLDDGLSELASLDLQLARVVELRLFGGLTIEETARLLEVSPMTVKRQWRMAKGWLHRRITERS